MSKATLSFLEKEVETNDYFDQLWAAVIAEAEKANDLQREEVGTYKFLGFRSNAEVEADNQGYGQSNTPAPQLSDEFFAGGRYRFLGFLN
jgi:hypothetical protein